MHWRIDAIDQERLWYLLENSATDTDVASEGALLVNVGSLNCSFGGFEA